MNQHYFYFSDRTIIFDYSKFDWKKFNFKIVEHDPTFMPNSIRIHDGDDCTMFHNQEDKKPLTEIRLVNNVDEDAKNKQFEGYANLDKHEIPTNRDEFFKCHYFSRFTLEHCTSIEISSNKICMLNFFDFDPQDISEKNLKVKYNPVVDSYHGNGQFDWYDSEDKLLPRQLLGDGGIGLNCVNGTYDVYGCSVYFGEFHINYKLFNGEIFLELPCCLKKVDVNDIEPITSAGVKIIVCEDCNKNYPRWSFNEKNLYIKDKKEKIDIKTMSTKNHPFREFISGEKNKIAMEEQYDEFNYGYIIRLRNEDNKEEDIDFFTQNTLRISDPMWDKLFGEKKYL